MRFISNTCITTVDNKPARAIIRRVVLLASTLTRCKRVDKAVDKVMERWHRRLLGSLLVLVRLSLALPMIAKVITTTKAMQIKAMSTKGIATKVKPRDMPKCRCFSIGH